MECENGLRNGTPYPPLVFAVAGLHKLCYGVKGVSPKIKTENQRRGIKRLRMLGIKGWCGVKGGCSVCISPSAIFFKGEEASL